MIPTYRLRLAHINDTHSNFDPSRVHFRLALSSGDVELRCHSGGYARIAHQIRQARLQAADSGDEFLFLHGGDSFQGTLYFSQFKGAANAHLLNLLRPDAMVLGNHEIDAGNGPVRSFLDRIDFPLLAGNMDLSREDPLKTARLAGHDRLLDYDPNAKLAKVLTRPFHGRQLAIMGITLDQMSVIARPDPDTHFIDAISTTARTVADLKARGIDHILVLSHLGLDQDRELAARVDGISLIVGGHSHSLQGDFRSLGLGCLPYGERVNDTPIVHAGKYAETLGLADIVMDEGGKVISLAGNNFFMLDREWQIDPEQQVGPERHAEIMQQLEDHEAILWDEHDLHVQQVIDSEYRPALDAMENQILAWVPRDLVHSRLPSKSLPHGSELAPWISRSMFQEAKALEPSVDFALHNAGGVRQSLARGQLSLADVVGRILPFELPLVAYKIRGEHLYQALESAIDAATNNGVVGTGAGSFPYAWGLRYSYDGRNKSGERITRLEVQRSQEWHSVCHRQDYVGVSSAYTAKGKEGYQALLNMSWQQPLPTLTLSQAFVRFVSTQSLDEELAPTVEYISQHV